MSNLPLHNEKELLTAIAGGDQTAFATLYEHYRRKVYFIAWRLLQSASESEDVQQEIFTKIWVHRAKMNEIENFNAYLNTLIRNHVFNALQKKARETSYLRESLNFNDVQADNAFQSADMNELQKDLQQAIRDLPRQQQKVFQLVRIEGRKHAEVADLLGISKSTVKKHVMEAQKNITARFSGRVNFLLLLLLTTA